MITHIHKWLCEKEAVHENGSFYDEIKIYGMLSVTPSSEVYFCRFKRRPSGYAAGMDVWDYKMVVITNGQVQQTIHIPN